MLEHTIRLHTRKTIYLIVTFLHTYFYIHILRFYVHILHFIASYSTYQAVKFYSFSLENDDIESSRRYAHFFSLVFITKCLTKSIFIRCFCDAVLL